MDEASPVADIFSKCDTCDRLAAENVKVTAVRLTPCVAVVSGKCATWDVRECESHCCTFHILLLWLMSLGGASPGTFLQHKIFQSGVLLMLLLLLMSPATVIPSISVQQSV